MALAKVVPVECWGKKPYCKKRQRKENPVKQQCLCPCGVCMVWCMYVCLYICVYVCVWCVCGMVYVVCVVCVVCVWCVCICVWCM